MLNINNKDDVEKMMQYHRTSDMINLIKFFPDLSPIENLTIVMSYEDYMQNYNFCKALKSERNDTLRIKPSMKSVETNGFDFNPKELFDKIKSIDEDGVLVLFDLCHEPSDRYKRHAGISVGVSLGNAIYIDAVGKGFDGREVSKGLSTHERYMIPWFDIRRCNIDNFKEFRDYIISNDEYQISRQQRIDFLTSVGYEKELVNSYIPTEYQEIPNFIWLDIIKNLIKKLDKLELELHIAALDEFAISGHTEGDRYRPWQIFDKSRYQLKRTKSTNITK